MEVFPKSSYKRFCNLHLDFITRMESRGVDSCFEIFGQDRWIGEAEGCYVLVVFRGSILSISIARREMELKENLKPVGRIDAATGCTLRDIMQGFGWSCDEDQIWDNKA